MPLTTIVRVTIHNTFSQRHGLLRVTRDVLATDGVLGLWRGTAPSLFRYVILNNLVRQPFTDQHRNVPGVALYMTSLTQVRTLMAKTAFFVSSHSPPNSPKSGSILPKLSVHGNLLAGAVTRVSVGFILNPFSVLKARFEVSLLPIELNRDLTRNPDLLERHISNEVQFFPPRFRFHCSGRSGRTFQGLRTVGSA